MRGETGPDSGVRTQRRTLERRTLGPNTLTIINVKGVDCFYAVCRGEFFEVLDDCSSATPALPGPPPSPSRPLAHR